MEITCDDKPLVIRVSGKVDFLAADEFAAAIAGVAVVDLTEVTWLCGAACAELVWAHQACGQLRVLPPDRSRIEDPEAVCGLTTVQWVLPRQRRRVVPVQQADPVGVG